VQVSLLFSHFLRAVKHLHLWIFRHVLHRERLPPRLWETRTLGALFTWWKKLNMYPGYFATLLWLTRLARPQWTVGGRFGEAFPLSTSDAPPRHPVSTSLTLTVTLTLSTSDSIATSAESLHRYPDSLSLSFSLSLSLR